MNYTDVDNNGSYGHVNDYSDDDGRSDDNDERDDDGDKSNSGYSNDNEE